MNCITSRLRVALGPSWALLFICAALPGTAMAVQDEPWVGVDNQTLSELRGGFINNQGFQINFQLENIVSIDGVLRAHNTVQIPWGMGVPRLHNLQDSDEASGAALRVTSNGLATLVQNSWDNKTIQRMQVVNVEMRNLSGIVGIGVINRIQPGLISSLR